MRLIDADELKEDLRGHFKDVMGNFVFNTTFAEIESIIGAAPTVEQFDDTELQRAVGYSDGYLKGKEERPQGEWIVGEYMDCHSDILPEYTCPFCGEVAYRKYDFCHCGADMRRECCDD